MEEDIRRKGMLYFHQQRFGKKWRKVWCVLVAEGRRSVARLELYEHKHSSFKQGFTKRKPDYKQVICLRECIRISNYDMADCPKDCATFLLETSHKLYVFAGLQSEVKDWISSLCQQAFPDVEAEQRSQRERCISSEAPGASSVREIQENSLYDTAENVRDVLVIAVRTEAAVRCGLCGEYVLTPLQDCIVLKDLKSKKVLFKWPYCYVRKFGQDALSFSFEAGRRCESGEGNFEFVTHQGERLFNAVSAAIVNLPKPSETKPISLDQAEQTRVQETTAGTYNGTIGSQLCDFLPEDKKAHQNRSKMFNPAKRSFSLNSIEPQIESQKISVNFEPENQEPVYARVSKAQQKNISPTNSQMHWQNLRTALQQSAFFTDAFKSDADVLPDLPISWDEYEEISEDCIGFLGDSIQQLAINDTLQTTSEEAIYADPQDVQDNAEWDVSGVYDEPEEVMKANQRAHDGANHLAEQDFFYSPDTSETQATDSPSELADNSDAMFSIYDNFRLKGRRM